MTFNPCPAHYFKGRLTRKEQEASLRVDPSGHYLFCDITDLTCHRPTCYESCILYGMYVKGKEKKIQAEARGKESVLTGETI